MEVSPAVRIGVVIQEMVAADAAGVVSIQALPVSDLR